VDDPGRWAGLLAEAAAERDAQPRRISELCVEMLGVTGAGISMMTSVGNHGVVCATDEVSARIEDLQLTLGEGPCVDSVRSGAPVLVPDLTASDEIVVDRWPAFLEGAGAAGVRAVFAFPLRIGAIRVGAMDLYRDVPGELGGNELPAALMAADAAAHALLDLGSPRDAVPGGSSDFRATYHPQVHQATGMVQEQLGVTTVEAFAILRARAFATDVALVQLAGDVVSRRLRFSREDL
jgi:GAF domain/ANTAR domain